jgi:ABC-type amino acid transport substrate-binding protein
VEIAGLIARKLGVKLVLERVGSPDRIPFVVADKIDFVMGAMTRTAERAKVIDFTVPVHTEQFGVLTTQGKPFKALAGQVSAGNTPSSRPHLGHERSNRLSPDESFSVAARTKVRRPAAIYSRIGVSRAIVGSPTSVEARMDLPSDRAGHPACGRP